MKECVRFWPDLRYDHWRTSERPVYLTNNHAKRIRPAAATLRVSAFVVPTMDGSIWLDPPGSFG
jgi:hypothetical protein